MGDQGEHREDQAGAGTARDGGGAAQEGHRCEDVDNARCGGWVTRVGSGQKWKQKRRKIVVFCAAKKHNTHPLTCTFPARTGPQTISCASASRASTTCAWSAR